MIKVITLTMGLKLFIYPPIRCRLPVKRSRGGAGKKGEEGGGGVMLEDEGGRKKQQFIIEHRNAFVAMSSNLFAINRLFWNARNESGYPVSKRL